MARERKLDGTEPPQEPPDESPKPPKLDAVDRELATYVAENAHTMGRGDAVKAMAEANRRSKKGSTDYCEIRYDVGELLVEFIAKKGHIALGYTDAGPCIRARFGKGRTWAKESMRFSRVATRSDIEGMEWEVAELGMLLLGLTDSKDFGELKKKPLPVLTPDMEPAYFPAPVELLQAAIKELERQKKEAAPEEEAHAREKALQRKADAIVERHLAKNPELAAANPRVFIRDGKARWDANPVDLGSDTFLALAALFADLRRAIERG